MSFTLQDSINQTRVFLKDTTENVWTNDDIEIFVNDAIKIVRAKLPEYFDTLVAVSNLSDVIVIDDEYTFLIPLFASSRCFGQDEQYYKETQRMNEFESRLAEAVDDIRSSDAYYTKVSTDGTMPEDFVEDVYWTDYSDSDVIGLE